MQMVRCCTELAEEAETYRETMTNTKKHPYECQNTMETEFRHDCNKRIRTIALRQPILLAHGGGCIAQNRTCEDHDPHK
jgi:hypothetical protein